MQHPLSTEELQQLRAIFKAWTLNLAFVPDETVVSALVSKGLVYGRPGNGMRLTSAGLLQVRNGERS